jgi:S-formylglutathione hydrolase FrmB
MVYGADYFTYIADELPDFLARYLPISRRKEDSFIAGNSMGGYGAFEIAMRRPEQYSAAVSLSGPMRIDWIWRVLSDEALASLAASKDPAAISRGFADFAWCNSIPEPLVHSLMRFGDPCTARTFRAMFGADATLQDSELDLFALAARLERGNMPLKLLAYCGTEDYHYGSNLLFQDYAGKTALDYMLITGGGAHDWTYWNRQIEDFMGKLFFNR